MTDSSPKPFERRRNDQDQISIDRLEERLNWVVMSLAELKVNDAKIQEKIDANNAALQKALNKIMEDTNQAKGAAKVADWFVKNWASVIAMIAAGLAVMNSGGGPPTP